jgi:2'-5' RNA ligase
MKEIEFSCIMVGFDLPNFQEFTEKFIHPEDVLKLEETPHVTICFGLSPNISLDEVKSLLLPLKDIYITSSEINEFIQDGFEVVKFAVSAPLLEQMNDVMTSTLDYTKVNPGRYKPHLTISYVKPGTALSYKRTIQPLILKPVNYIFSRPNGETIYFTI